MTSSSSLAGRFPAVIMSSYCKANGCVGVGLDGDEVVIVDTKVDGPALRLSRTEWAEFTVRAKNGELDTL